jgi:hydrogenase-4 component F
MAFGEGSDHTPSQPLLYLPEIVHLSLVLVAGVYIPAPVVEWFQHVASLLG